MAESEAAERVAVYPRAAGPAHHERSRPGGKPQGQAKDSRPNST